MCPPASPTQVRSLAGLRFSAAGNPGIEVEFLPEAGSPVPLPARLGDSQDSGKEEECTVISQRLLHHVKVTVRAAKQDVG